MRFTFHILLLALVAALAYAASAQKAVIISYPKDTPDSVVDKAKAAIKEAVGCDKSPSSQPYAGLLVYSLHACG